MSTFVTAPPKPPAPPKTQGPPKTKSQLLRSFDVADFPALTGREEEWRFTPLKRLRGLDTVDGSAEGAALEYRHTAPAGTSVSTVERGSPSGALVPFDRVSALAFGAARTALVVSVAREATPAEPVRVTLVGAGTQAQSYGHTVLDIGELAEVTVVLEYTGSVTLADNVEILVGDGARLTLVTVADWADDAVQLQHLKFRLGRDARVKHVQVSLGGDLVRQFASVDYTGRGGEAELYGLYFADAHQHFEHRLLVDHAVPDCRSFVSYRGALQGKAAHTIWVGDVLIRAAATGTDTYEVNRNLILTDGARADSVPNLEIETGEVVGAGHASATGRFDDEQLFYLMSRGISETEARRLVVRGFFAELLGKIPVEELRERLGARIEARLGERVSLDATYIKVCSTSDIAAGDVVAADVNGVSLAIVHCGDGQFRAVYDQCSHAQIALSEGEVDDCTLECWLHGSRFDLRTGQPSGLPATEPVPIYPVEIHEGDIYVSLVPSNGVEQP